MWVSFEKTELWPGSGHSSRALQSMCHLINDAGLEVHEDRPGHVLAGPRLREEGVEAVVRDAERVVRGHHAVGVDPVLQAVQLPGN